MLTTMGHPRPWRQGAPSMARVAHLPSGERLVGWIVTVKAMREPRAPSPVR